MIKKRLENQELKTIHGGKDVVAAVNIDQVCGDITDPRISVVIKILVSEGLFILAFIDRVNVTGKSCEI